jgi:hypothetical protein
MMRTLLSEVDIFGLTNYGDGATIKSVPLIYILAAGTNNPFALLNIFVAPLICREEVRKIPSIYLA